MKPNKNQFQTNPYGNVLPSKLIEEQKPLSSLIGSEVDKRADKLVRQQKSGKHTQARTQTTMKTVRELLGMQGKLLEPLGRSIRRSSDKEATGILLENNREAKTAAAVKNNPKISSLNNLAKAGKPTEVSGDAIARAKRGDAPKLITTTPTWKKHKKDIGVKD